MVKGLAVMVLRRLVRKALKDPRIIVDLIAMVAREIEGFVEKTRNDPRVDTEQAFRARNGLLDAEGYAKNAVSWPQNGA